VTWRRIYFWFFVVLLTSYIRYIEQASVAKSCMWITFDGPKSRVGLDRMGRDQNYARRVLSHLKYFEKMVDWVCQIKEHVSLASIAYMYDDASSIGMMFQLHVTIVGALDCHAINIVLSIIYSNC
jgi:hypothetical protein